MSIIVESHYPRAIIGDIIVETNIATMESELPARVLPSFKSMSCLSCAWGSLLGHEFSVAICRAYSETIRDLIFSRFHQELVESVVSELARLFDAFAKDLAFEAFALEA